MLKLKNSVKNFKQPRIFIPTPYAIYRRKLAMLDNYCIPIAREMQRKNKNAYDKAMALKPSKTVSSLTNNRQLHVSSVSKIAKIIGQHLGLNLNLIEVMAEQHDRGHTFYAHEVEHIFNAYLENYGIGHFTHNAEGPRQFLFVDNIDEICIDSIHHIDPQLSQNQLNTLSGLLWYIHDGVLGHNGESPTFEFRPNTSKTKQDFFSDLKKSFTVKNYDRKIVPATIEGCLMKLCDIISYVAQDLADGLQESIITDLDDTYMDILSSFGITKSTIRKAIKQRDYDSIVRAVEDVCILDVMEHSSKSIISMSSEMAKNVNDLRHYNYLQIVRKNITPKEEAILARSVGSSIALLSDVLVEGKFLSELLADGKINMNDYIQLKYPDKKYKGFITFLAKLGPNYVDYIKELCSDGARASIMEETQIAMECIQNGLDKLPEPQNEKDKKIQAETPVRTQRINNIISCIQKRYGSDLSYFNPEDFCNRIMDRLEKNVHVEGYLTMNERMTALISTNFLATLSDEEFRYFITVNELITPEEHAILKTKYADIPESEYGYPSALINTLRKTSGKETDDNERE